MKLRLLWHIVRRQFITQRLVIIPFILAVSVLFMIEYTLVSIGLNSYIKQKNDFLVPFIIIANFFMALLTFIFIFYANHFMMSQRRKEFSIFMTLGMTKKSMRLIVVMETILQFVIISVVSIAGGYLLGAIFFLFIQKIMGSEVATLRYYPFDSVAMFITLIIIAVLMGMLLIFNLFSINFQRPITYQHRSDSSVISRWLRYVLIVKDNNQLQKVKGFYAHEQKDSTISINFNVFGKTKLTTSQIQKLSKKYDASINSKSEMLMVWDRLTGGLIFVGGVVSIVLVIGIFLMMYYKQVSEAYANQHNYDIMKKLGLDNGRIAKITRNQMTFLFAIPITVALIHTLISSNIVYTLLNMIGINNHHIFLTSYVLAVIIISFLYMAMYKITSYIYAKVIHQQRN
ncbi:FtsX-like permease family protein [Staphylococcus aureus]|uniref:FtsX-like permease family protein n=1 Tax=Staphylococcus aureus TaxID=1280 RepID=UPI0023800454|nr:ABC transporter permease [Staphylococcus aureus]MDE4520326.1 FtsX-like permease family protein [Staphylococcus aureus]